MGDFYWIMATDAFNFELHFGTKDQVSLLIKLLTLSDLKFLIPFPEKLLRAFSSLFSSQ